MCVIMFNFMHELTCMINGVCASLWCSMNTTLVCEYHRKNSESSSFKLVQSIKSQFLNYSGVQRSRNRRSGNALKFFMSRRRNAKRNHNTKIASKLFRNVSGPYNWEQQQQIKCTFTMLANIHFNIFCFLYKQLKIYFCYFFFSLLSGGLIKLKTSNFRISKLISGCSVLQ